jgi:hypothetical protein
MKFLARIFLLLFALADFSGAADLDALLYDQKLWQSDAKSLATAHPDIKFGWSSADHKAARIYGTNTLFDLAVADATFEMNDEKPVGITIVFYDRGDSGDISKEKLATIVSNAQQKVGAWAGSKAVPANDQLKTTGVRRDGVVWTSASCEARMSWSYSTKDPGGHLGFRAEYVKLHLAPAGIKQTSVPAAALGVSATSMKSKIKREENGDVVLTGVPMVDQGEKGYCAVASAERVMRFYGIDVDQHELAQLAATSAQGGTDPRAMLDSLRRVGLKLGCKVKVLQDFSVQEFVRLIDHYNQTARKRKSGEIKYGREINIADVYGQMDANILREVRSKPPSDTKNFLGSVCKNVDQGVPLLWGVELGKVEEKPSLPKQATGGHMRLIIGYNTKAGEILYTDSWGPGHELKHMSVEDAWTITSALFLIEPRHTTL